MINTFDLDPDATFQQNDFDILFDAIKAIRNMDTIALFMMKRSFTNTAFGKRRTHF